MAEENQRSKPTQGQLTESKPTLLRTYGHLLRVNSAAKTEWPELVGLTAEEAERKIKEERPGTQIHVVKSGSLVTMEFRQDRVRIWVDSSRKVERAPRVG